MSTDTERYVVRAATSGPVVTDVSPESAGWDFSGLRVVTLAPGASLTWHLERDEAALIPLRGGAELLVDLPDGATRLTLTGRPDVFSGPTDFAYLPLGSTVTVTAPKGAASGSRIALATARATRTLPLRVVAAQDVRVDLRGAGAASRQVNNYTLGTDVAIDHLLVCEVVTPGGNWSSYPPHKHDVHSGDERVLEEIYYFEVADGPDGPGVGYHRTYGTPERPIDVLAEVRTGDVALVPHGFHGPCTAPPGYDLYYLNVMAGPAPDGTWLSTDDPHLHWVRATWEHQELDPRLPLATRPDNDGTPSKEKEQP
ncbi:5-deoxy-glucuronate isomerase [Sanguibacter gelidistatuariae]|uniref:5-deoxy-glucuronate isomerase n=1 Tax=Sanguibacter gelidistatuariae TaxID=1814289 RepID=A0A1G6HPH3_9MICO|nr:5-deoxy-glucuronate isomerase [Sanguibacter gelidistatuariae]SDB96197.1 5-deoxy-glucuronate isomerase [Sanguibacter gelidistatuariae]